MEKIRSDPDNDSGACDLTAYVDKLSSMLDRWNHKEIHSVRRLVRASQAPLIRKLSIFINYLGNGWIYLILVLLLLALQGSSSFTYLLAAGTAAAIAHSIYPAIKRRLARFRPCDYDPSLKLSVKVLDEYSCPSGHVMTSTAVSIPLAIAYPQLLPVVVICCLSIAWARVSLGHHYPSDLLLGFLLGSVITMPSSLLLL